MFYKIKEARIAKDMTQEELARKSGVSRFTIINIESGKTTNMQTETLCKIAKALDVSLDEIFFTESV